MKKISLFVAAVGIAAGCSGGSDTSENKSATNTETPAASTITGGATFASVQGILTQNCAGCHGANGKAGVNLTSYATIVREPLVKAGDAENSVLAQVLRAGHGKKQMPPKGPLPDADIKTVEDWINAGAKQS